MSATCDLYVIVHIFLQSVQQNSLTPEKLRIYRDIWIQMKSLTDTLSSLNTFFLLLLLTLPTLIIGAFLCMLYLQERRYHVSCILFIFCCTIVLFIGFLGSVSDRFVGEVRVYIFRGQPCRNTNNVFNVSDKISLHRNTRTTKV